MIRIAVFFVVITTVGLTPLGVNAQAFGEYSGEDTFLRFCASCHGEQARGDGPVASAIPITVPDLTLIRRRQGEEFPEQTLRKIIDGRDVVIFHGSCGKKLKDSCQVISWHRSLYDIQWSSQRVSPRCEEL